MNYERRHPYRRDDITNVDLTVHAHECGRRGGACPGPPNEPRPSGSTGRGVVSRHLYVAAQMNLADLLAEGPRTAVELAQSSSTDAPSLYRFSK